MKFLFETAPHQLEVKFNDHVGDSLGESDLLVRNVTTNTIVLASAFEMQPYDDARNSSLIRFSSILADGNCTVSFSGTGIENSQAMDLAGDLVQDFFVFAGDANRDRVVNISDFAILAGRFNLPGTFSQGDFNYDGVANIGDFSILASKFNRSLPAPAALPRSISALPFSRTRILVGERELLAEIV